MRKSDRSTAIHPDAERYFTAGLESVFRQWTVLELAVQNQWGGPASAEKAATLHMEVLNLFRSPEKIYKDVSSLIRFLLLFYFNDHLGRQLGSGGLLRDQLQHDM
jgi:hypothetical protein